jgi:hypothetical protein
MNKFEVGQVWLNGRGQRVRIICVDRNQSDYPIVGLLDLGKEEEEVMQEYTADGWYHNFNHSPEYNLVALAPKEITVRRWINVVKTVNGRILVDTYETEHSAVNANNRNYIVLARAVPFTWTGTEPE